MLSAGPGINKFVSFSILTLTHVKNKVNDIVESYGQELILYSSFIFFFSTFVVLTKDRTASHIIDSLLESNDKATCLEIIKILTENANLASLACHPVANHVIQKLLLTSAIDDHVSRCARTGREQNRRAHLDAEQTRCRTN